MEQNLLSKIEAVREWIIKHKSDLPKGCNVVDCEILPPNADKSETAMFKNEYFRNRDDRNYKTILIHVPLLITVTNDQ